MPSTEITSSEMSIVDVLVLTGLAPSKGQARTLISQGGITLNDKKITDINSKLSQDDFSDGYAIIKKGKKVFHKLIIS